MAFFGKLLGAADDDEEGPPYTDQSAQQPSLLDRARQTMGMQPTRREAAIDACCPKMTYKQRLYGFAICFGIGVLVSSCSMIFFMELLHGRPTKFAVNYTLGNIIALASTFFLVGPVYQLKRMTSPTRWITALVYVCAMGATLFCALGLHRVAPNLNEGVEGALTLACIIVQFLAMFWYCLSYIPFGRRMCKACCESAMADSG